MDDIIIEIEGDGVAPEPAFTIRLIRAGGAPAEAVLTPANLAVGNWPPIAMRNRVLAAPIHDRSGPDFKEIAETLWQWLFPLGPVRDAWTAHFDLADPPSVWLSFRDADALASLPWELARNPETGDRLGSGCGLGRLVDLAKPPDWDWTDWPFRILVLAGSADQDGSLGIAAELAAIDRILLPCGRSVDVVRLERPTRRQLAECIEGFRPHVLHFAGHGDQPLGGEPGLLFEPPGDGGFWTWTGEDIRSDLGDWRWVPRFVFLNACRTGTGPAGTWNAQQAFLARGTRAAIGMQADMAGDLAGLFAAVVYRELAAERTLSEAVVKARKAILAEPNQSGRVNYAVPQVAASPNLQLFRRRPVPADPGFAVCREFAETRFFADCSEYRRRAIGWFYPRRTGGAAGSRPAPRALVLTGEARSGKSHLLKWCMETWALGEARVRYVELHERSMTFLEVLRQIRLGEIDLNTPNTDAYRFLHAPLPAPAFRRYRWELQNLLEKGVAGEWVEAERAAAPPLPDEGGTLPASGDKRLEPAIAASFRAALEQAAGGRPLILVFDRFSGDIRKLLCEDFRQLVAHLFTPLAQDPASQVHLVFCATSTDARDYGLNDLPALHTERLELAFDHTPEQLVEYAAEAVRFQQADVVRDIARAVFKLPDPSGALGRGLGRLSSVWKVLEHYPGLAWQRME